MPLHLSTRLRSGKEHRWPRQHVLIPLWIAASAIGQGCSRPDGDILYRPFGTADQLTDGIAGSAGLLDAGDSGASDPMRDASHTGAGGAGPVEPIDSGLPSDAASPLDEPEAGAAPPDAGSPLLDAGPP